MNVLQMSISGGFLIIGIIVVRTLIINRFFKKFFVLLWDVVLLRLLLPITVTIQFVTTNLFTSVPKQIDQVIQQRVSDLPIIKDASGTYLPVDAGVAQQGNNTVFQIIWLSGMIALSLFFIIAFYRDYRKLREALPIKHHIFINHWMNEKQLKRKIVILLSDRVNTPVTYGIFSPKIILPRTMDLTDHKALRFVLEHELVHIKSHDNLWKIVALTALCIHWFNPFVWIMQILFNRDLELSCDEKVIASMGADKRQEYALTLINLAVNKSGISFLHSCFGKNVIKERIVSIMKYKKTSIISIICVLALITVVSVFWFTSPGNGKTPASALESDKQTESQTSATSSQNGMESSIAKNQTESQKNIIASANDRRTKPSEQQMEKTTAPEKEPVTTYTASGFVSGIEGSIMYLQEENQSDNKVAYELINAVINVPGGVKLNQTVDVRYYIQEGKNFASEVNGDGSVTPPIDTEDYFSGSYELTKDGISIQLSISSYTDWSTSARGNVVGTINNSDGTESGFYGELIKTDTVNQYDVTTDNGLTCRFIFSGDTLNITSSPETISGVYNKTGAYRPS